MNDPRRLIEESGSELELALLRSAKEDAPSPHARRRTLMALGLGAGLVTASSSTAAASITGLALVKWVGLGVLGGALVVGGVQQATHAPAPRAAPAIAQGPVRVAQQARVVSMQVIEPAQAVSRPDTSEPPA